jgi:integrase
MIDRALAEKMSFTLDYNGSLTKSDARKVLEKLIADSNATPVAFNSKTTFRDLAREYIAMNKPGWDADTARVNEQLIKTHLIGKLGDRPVRELTDDVELQDLINGYVEAGSSQSLLTKLVMFLRAILKRAVKRELIKSNPAEEVKARSRKKRSGLRHTSEECAALYAAVFGRDHLAIRMLVELGLRSEELFALRRNDVCGDELVIDEAIPNGRLKETKTKASEASVFIPPDLAIELRLHLETVDASPTAWLFPSNRKHKAIRPGNFLNRVLKPAAIRAGIAVTTDANGRGKTALNFQSLRRTSATLFGAKAKDPKLTQSHMRHASAKTTLEIYQKSIPAEVRAAAIALEADLLEAKRKRKAELEKETAHVRVV